MAKMSTFRRISLVLVVLGINVLLCNNVHAKTIPKRTNMQFKSRNRGNSRIGDIGNSEEKRQKSGTYQDDQNRLREMCENTEKTVRLCHELHFADPPLPVTALVAFPGSGTTWLKHLLEQATGFITGSVYKDPLSMNVLPGARIKNGSVLVVKMHRSPKIIANYNRVIMLVRNPFEALLSEFNRRRSKSKTDIAKAQDFRSQKWKNFIATNIDRWLKLYKEVLTLPKPMLIVEYKNLKENTADEILRITKFLGVAVESNDIECILTNSEGCFKRKPWKLAYTPYTDKEIRNVKVHITQLNEELERHKFKMTIDSKLPHVGKA